PRSTRRLTAMISISIVPSAVRSALLIRNVPRSMVEGLGVIVTPLMRIIRSRLPRDQPEAGALLLAGQRRDQRPCDALAVDLQDDLHILRRATLQSLHPRRVTDGLVHGPVHGVLD